MGHLSIIAKLPLLLWDMELFSIFDLILFLSVAFPSSSVRAPFFIRNRPQNSATFDLSLPFASQNISFPVGIFLVEPPMRGPCLFSFLPPDRMETASSSPVATATCFCSTLHKKTTFVPASNSFSRYGFFAWAPRVFSLLCVLIVAWIFSPPLDGKGQSIRIRAPASPSALLSAQVDCSPLGNSWQGSHCGPVPPSASALCSLS